MKYNLLQKILKQENFSSCNEVIPPKTLFFFYELKRKKELDIHGRKSKSNGPNNITLNWSPTDIIANLPPEKNI